MQLKAKIKTKELELAQLKSTFHKDLAAVTEELETIETKLKVSVDTKIKAEEEIRRLRGIIENCDENISRLQQEKKTRESFTEINLAKKIYNIREKIKRKREEIENEMDNQLELQLRKKKQGKLTGDVIVRDQISEEIQI